jgi:predicted RNA binding protein YcfA (HicA-like mRNA interferase family)
LSELKPISTTKLIKVLLYLDYTPIRQKGSHRVFMKENKMIVVPIHNKDIGRGLLRNIINQIGITKEQFQNILKIKS